MILAVIVSFLNEEQLLPRLLSSIEAQTRSPDELLLVDDGSSDSSHEVAAASAASHSYARVLKRSRRPRETDRLATAAELQSFQWALPQLKVAYDVVVKLDADLELAPDHFETILREFERDPKLGIAGAFLSVRDRNGRLVREQHPTEHVRGPNRFYRRACLEDIRPLPAHLGWDTIDEVKARMHGWRTRSFALPGGDSVHLRPTGTQDGPLRGFRRWGECAYGFGAHPLAVLLSAAWYVRRRPYVLGSLNFVVGWLVAAVRRVPRGEPQVRAFRRAEDLQRIRRLIGLAAIRPSDQER